MSIKRNTRLNKLLKLAGIFEPPPALVEDVFQWAREKYCARVLGEAEKSLKKPAKQDDPELVSLLLLKRECLKHANGPTTANQHKTSLPLNFDGWKYAKGPEDWPLYEQIQQTGDMELQVELNIAVRKWPSWSGFWNWKRGKVILNTKVVYDAESLNAELTDLKQTIYHELQHLGQYWFEYEQEFFAGIPPKETQQGDSSAMPKALHKSLKRPGYHLQDQEFYPMLKSEIENELKPALREVPAKYRMEVVKRFINPHYTPHIEGLDKKDEKRLSSYLRTSPFFIDLLKHSKPKYRKAVIELFKAIQETDLLKAASMKTAGIWEPPPVMVEQIFDWALDQMCARMLFELDIEFAAEPNPAYRQELEKVRQLCRQYTDEMIYENRVWQYFPIDLTNWKYLRGPAPEFENPYIGVSMQFIRPGTNYLGGLWDHNTNTLYVTLPLIRDEEYSVVHFNWLTHELYNTIHHELQHMAQALLHKVKQLQQLEYVPPFEAGYPSRSIQNRYRDLQQRPEHFPEDVIQPGTMTHSLRDVEFYTDLRDEAEVLKRNLAQVPTKERLKVVKEFIDPTFTAQFDMDAITDEEYTRIKSVLRRSRFFQELRQYEPAKYRKAVKELWKEIKSTTKLE